VVAQDSFGDTYYYLKRQLLFAVILGLPALWLGFRASSERLSRWAVPLLVGAVALLILVLSFGVERGGARRWLGWGPFMFQPSEIAQVAIIIFAAWYASWSGKRMLDLWRGVVPYLVVVALLAFLILVQPNLSTALVVALVALAMLFLGGAKWQHVVSLVLIVAVLGGIAVALAPYRAERIVAFLNPEEHKQDAAFQPYQSMIALGSGGPTGVGFSRSTQKYYYIPAAFTDFIFAIIGEEWGFVGTTMVIGLFALFVVRAVRIARSAKDVFSALVAAGIAVMVATEASAHVAVAANVVPTTGMPLPFISYGGSALVMKLFCVGVLLSISRRAVV
jgi:cell division protein FtsW